MTRRIKYKTVSDEYNRLGAPVENSKQRFGVGADQSMGEFYYIDIEDLIPFQNQARKVFNEDELSDLASSVKLYGIRQPLTIISSNLEENKYEVVSGERRLRAAKLAGLNKVPCIMLSGEGQDPNSIALVENVHRADLHPIELMNIYNELLEKEIYSSLSDLSNKIGIPLSTVSETMSLGKLPSKTLNLLLEKQVKSRALQRLLLKLPESEHKSAIENYEDAKQEKSVVKKKIFKSKIKVLNIVHQSDKFHIENNRLNELSNQQKEEIKSLIYSILEKL